MTDGTSFAIRPSGFDGVERKDSFVSSAGVQRNNLSAKVATVLSASYADTELRDALSLLDARGVESSAETRRNLRSDIQKEVIDSNGDIIKEFGHVAERLRRIGQTISQLNQGYEEMRSRINAAHRETAAVLAEASELLQEKEQTERQKALLNAFKAHFIMSDDDVGHLTSTAEAVDDRFFILLTKAKRIQSDCELLLGTENQGLGLEILDQVSRNLNGAFQKLYRWIQKEFKSLNLENPQISSSIRRALRVLAERPSLFQNCLDFFAEAREHILSDAFFTALTGTSASGEEDKTVKPIELVAHDPLRYVGDMLAWVHSATVSEREALEVLFISDGNEIARGIQAGRDSEPWRKLTEDVETSDFDALKALNDLVDQNVAGVARVLRQRIEQVIQSHEEILLAYKIANLLNFYRTTFSRSLGRDSVLLETLASLEDSAMRQFRILLHDNIASLQVESESTAVDLAPPELLQDGLKQLGDIMKTYETSLSPSESREREFEPILADALEPYLAASHNLSNNLQHPANLIYSINCLLLARSTLAPFDFTKARVDSINLEIDGNVERLIEDQYHFFIQSSGCFPLLQALKAKSGEPVDPAQLSTLAAFQPQALTDASQILDDFLPSALVDAMENIGQLQSSSLARQISEAAAERFCEDFETIEEAIISADAVVEDTRGEEEDSDEPRGLKALFPRTGEEIRVLLS